MTFVRKAHKKDLSPAFSGSPVMKHMTSATHPIYRCRAVITRSTYAGIVVIMQYVRVMRYLL